jgi:tubulin-specific chaperone A
MTDAKQCMIKTGTAKRCGAGARTRRARARAPGADGDPYARARRLVKEVAHYTKETTENEARVQKMRDDGKDSYDIKKAVEVLEETRMMVPDAERRLADALDDLFTFMGDHADNAEVNECKHAAEANALLEEHDALISS